MDSNPHVKILDLELEEKSCSFIEQDRRGKARHTGLADVMPGMEPQFHDVTGRSIRRDVQREKPEHRHAAFLLANGMSQKDTSKETGYSEGWISEMMTQEWFKDLVLYYIKVKRNDPIATLLRGAALDSFWCLQQMGHDPKVPPATREKIHQSNLDRFMGKAPVTVTHKHEEQVADPKSQADALREELEKIDKASREAQERAKQLQQQQQVNN